ncbi:MAG: hypothetical protein IJ740_05875 [Ruminococcus sp.]|nr:hypothetical protein [Ruminococcus sp.]
MAALKTASDISNKVADNENEAESSETEPYDREAETDTVLSNIEGYDEDESVQQGEEEVLR